MAARLTDEVTSELARLGTLQVVAHASAVRAAGEQRPFRDIADTLGADVVVAANITADNGALHVEAVLIDAASERKFWVEEFSALPADRRTLERRLAVAVSSAVARNTRGSYWTRAR